MEFDMHNYNIRNSLYGHIFTEKKMSDLKIYLLLFHWNKYLFKYVWNKSLFLTNKLILFFYN